MISQKRQIAHRCLIHTILLSFERLAFIFSRLYFSNGQAVVMGVVRPSSVRNKCIVAKRCKIGPRLLLITNRKSHTGFQMTCKSLTLGNLEGFQRTMEWNVPSYKWPYLGNGAR